VAGSQSCVPMHIYATNLSPRVHFATTEALRITYFLKRQIIEGGLQQGAFYETSRTFCRRGYPVGTVCGLTSPRLPGFSDVVVTPQPVC